MLMNSKFPFQAKLSQLGKIPSVFALSLLVTALTACDSTSTSSSSDPGIKTGVFIDSKVINIAYNTGSQSGFTNEEGEFNYRSGEVVTFSIGDIVFPSTSARNIVTLLDLVSTDKVDDPRVLSMSRLLLSFDRDGNPDNGIYIDPQAVAISQGTTIDFAQMPFDVAQFEADVVNLVANSGSVTTSLVSANEAQIHLVKSLSLIPIDTDGDGVIDTSDAFPNDPNESVDTDGDGVGDNSDFDPNDPNVQTICDSPAGATLQELQDAGCNNTLPVASFTLSQATVGPLSTVSLDASSTTDADGDMVSYLWEVTASPNGATPTVIGNTSAETTLLTLGDLQGAYTVSLTVSDSFGSHTVVQTVNVDKGLPVSGSLFGISLLLSGLLLIRRRAEVKK